MVKLGYKLMSEEHGPADLVRNARRAEEAGFDFAAISDHYFPGKGPRYAEVALCCAPTQKQGRKTAHRYFRWSLSGWPVLAELPHDEAFAAASEHVSSKPWARR